MTKFAKLNLIANVSSNQSVYVYRDWIQSVQFRFNAHVFLNDAIAMKIPGLGYVPREMHTITRIKQP